jgi:hypothetical protein
MAQIHIYIRSSNMAVTKDWLPTTRDDILAMAGDWISVCTLKKTGWNIPDPALTELTILRMMIVSGRKDRGDDARRRLLSKPRVWAANSMLVGFGL